MDSNKVGAVILRIFGDSASMEDVFGLLDELNRNADLRARCSVLSNLCKEMSDEERAQYCRATVVTMLNRTKPLEGLEPGGENEFLQTTPTFAAFCVPSKGGLWDAHIRARSRKGGNTEYGLVSPPLAERIRALEELWSVRGHLIYNKQ